LFETEKILAYELNQAPRTHQKVRPQKDESVRLELTLNQEQYEILKKAKSLISHSVPENNLAQVITYLAQAYIKKVEGSSQKAPSSQASKLTKSSALKETPNSEKAFCMEASSLTQGFGKKPVSRDVRRILKLKQTVAPSMSL
ncbi:MAG: hypothetical protein ACXVB1_11830, partial [Pseudobdellovibrionaceae bacterium]